MEVRELDERSSLVWDVSVWDALSAWDMWGALSECALSVWTVWDALSVCEGLWGGGGGGGNICEGM